MEETLSSQQEIHVNFDEFRVTNHPCRFNTDELVACFVVAGDFNNGKLGFMSHKAAHKEDEHQALLSRIAEENNATNTEGTVILFRQSQNLRRPRILDIRKKELNYEQISENMIRGIKRTFPRAKIIVLNYSNQHRDNSGKAILDMTTQKAMTDIEEIDY